jgi:uncharacterized damage-inducible protein DinB
MAERIKWIDRVFDLEVPPEIHPELIERLRGTPARLEDRLSGLAAETLVRREGDTWSIQEHAGHLTDVDALFLGRLDDYEAGLPELRPADMSGGKTFEAKHNESSLAEILGAFRACRMGYVARLESWDVELFARSSLHPRLKKTMRVCDMLHFQSEHDDYHLARITELMRRFLDR